MEAFDVDAMNVLRDVEGASGTRTEGARDMRGTLAKQGDPHGHDDTTWRDDVYTDGNGCDWKVFSDGGSVLHALTDGDTHKLWHAQPADSVTVQYYNGMGLKLGADASFGEGLDLLIDAIDDFVESYDQKNMSKIVRKGSGLGVLALIVIIAIAASDKKRR